MSRTTLATLIVIAALVCTATLVAHHHAAHFAEMAAEVGVVGFLRPLIAAVADVLGDVRAEERKHRRHAKRRSHR